MTPRWTLPTSAAAIAAGLVLAAAAPASAAPAAALPSAVAPAAASAITPNAWYIDQNERRFFTVKLNRTVCDGSVDVSIYGRNGKKIDWWFEAIDACTTSVTFDQDMYDWLAVGATGTGSAKIEVSDYGNDYTSVTRSLPFYVKTAGAQTGRVVRSGSYVTLSGTTSRYDLRSGFDAAWVKAAATTVQYQKLVGSTWQTVGTAKTDRYGNSSYRLKAASKATYRVLYPGSTTQGSAASAKLVK